MNTRYIACWLLGAWIAGTLFMIMVATQNFRSVDRLLAAPSGAATVQIQTMGRDQARAFLRYQVSEQNRWYFEKWEAIQLVLGALLLTIACLYYPKIVRVMVALVFALLLIERLYITPEIVRLGRVIDFIPQAVLSPERDSFWRFHHAYSGVELVKLALGFFLSARFILGGDRVAGKVDAVDEADHSHVNR